MAFETQNGQRGHGPRGRVPKILIVEDDSSVRWFVRETLACSGYRTVEATDGWGAMDAIKAGVDLVLLDIGLPGLDGWGVLDQLSELRDKTHIIVMTGHDEPEYAMRTAQAGTVDHLVKPFSATALEEAVERALATSSEAINWRRNMMARGADVYSEIAGLIAGAREVAG